MDESNVPITDVRAVESYIKKRESRWRSRGTASSSSKGPDAMVYGVSAPEAAAPQPSPAATAPEAPLVGNWAGVAADSWVGADFQRKPHSPSSPIELWMRLERAR